MPTSRRKERRKAYPQVVADRARKRKEKEHRGRQVPAQAAPAPRPVPQPPAAPVRQPGREQGELFAVQERRPEPVVEWLPKLDFTAEPFGTVRSPEDRIGSLAGRVAKTVRVPAALDMHVQAWLALHPGVDFQRTVLALVRSILREEDEARRAALLRSREPGQPVRVRSGPVTRALKRELEIMEEEGN